ncbi:ABC transporter substrate-binding protein [Actinotalea sp. K2]|uniref:ABC transporter substrate-binding protein n=1 Tax=Actinotalea sp. K2 TaxID=2939438 RepID=UPI002016C3F4|nr:extracellular solute-binding protein [Actinotalea sp. K2]MCL3859433.1 extracellular solute-binding protein [Actinotalea sp. K2]
MTVRHHRTTARRRLPLTITALACATALVACGSGDAGTDAAGTAGPAEGSGADGEQVQIRFSWWGNDNRHETTQQVIDLFEAEYPHIDVVPDYTDWGGYWDKLATTVAAGDAPDVITQEERYLREYGVRGALVDLNEHAGTIDLDQIDPSVAQAGEFEGALYGIPTGILSAAIVADPQVFADAGVEMPDDTTWSWEDYVEIANAVTAGTDDGVFGAQDYGFTEVGFAIYARQQGEELYAEDGSLGFRPETLEAWWQMAVDMREAGGNPPAAETVEMNADTTQSLMATGRGGMGLWWTSQLGPTEDASGNELELLRLPGESVGERTGMYFKPSMYYSIASTSAHPEEAALLVDFLLNDVEAGRLILSDRGLPANTDVRAALEGDFTDADRRSAAFLEDVAPEILDSLNTPPIGAGEVAGIMARMNEQVLFDQVTPAQAAEQFIAEVGAVIG